MGNKNNICLGLAPQDKSGTKGIHALNDFSEVTIGGVTYRVRSVFAGSGQLGSLLDLAAIEKLDRIA